VVTVFTCFPSQESRIPFEDQVPFEAYTLLAEALRRNPKFVEVFPMFADLAPKESARLQALLIDPCL
jgi:hypothetical protein